MKVSGFRVPSQGFPYQKKCTSFWLLPVCAPNKISKDCICGGGMMAAPGFEWKSLYTELKRAFLDLAAEVQQGLRDKGETQEL